MCLCVFATVSIGLFNSTNLASPSLGYVSHSQLGRKCCSTGCHHQRAAIFPSDSLIVLKLCNSADGHRSSSKEYGAHSCLGFHTFVEIDTC